MKYIIVIIIALISTLSFSQEDKEKEALLTLKKANNYVFQGNELVGADNYISAEMEYRKAISEQPTNVAGAYNLGNSYYQKGNFEEALYRHQQAAKSAMTKAQKHKAYHNIGNILMQNKQCKEAVEAFKNALRNDPTDNETRYNFAIAKECAQQQKDKEDEKKDEEKKDDEKKDEGENKDDKKDQGDEDKKEGEDKKDDEGKPKDDKQDQGKGDQEKKEQEKPKQQPGQLSPQQVKSLLEAMNNQEQKVQEKMNAEKQKGAKVKTEKDW
jgi:Ca-activated chloride channel family protein